MVNPIRWNYSERTVRARYGLAIPLMFSSVSEARNSLAFHWHQSSFSLSHVGEIDIGLAIAFSAWHQKSVKILEQWSSAFNTFIQARGNMLTENEKKGVGILRIQEVIAFTSLHLPRTKFDDQTLWDQFCPEFGRIITLASEIIGSNLGSRNSWFSLDLGLIGPLYETSARCRDPLIRRKAILLLKSANMQEGIWNSFLAAKVAERVVQIEEAELGDIKSCADVPDWARLSGVSPTFDPVERRAAFRYTRLGSRHNLVRRTVEEVIEW